MINLTDMHFIPGFNLLLLTHAHTFSDNVVRVSNEISFPIEICMAFKW